VSDVLVWTFTPPSPATAATFYPVDSDRKRPEGKRDGRVEVFNLVGTGLAEFHTFGYGEYTLQMNVTVLSDTHAATLKAAHLKMGTLVGDGTNVTAILFDVELKKARTDYHEGTMTFKWSGAS
jgi:hypothetical protein